MASLAFPEPPLATGALLLRPCRASDLRDLFEAFTDPETQRFSWAGQEPYRPADAQSYLADQEQGRRRGEQIQWVLARPTDDAFLGCASLYDVRRGQGAASVGYWLAAAARGRGVATTAVRLIARWAFEELGLDRLELTCGPDNLASQRVAARAGFTREGLLRSHLPFKGGRRDTVLFSLLPTDRVSG